MSSPHTTLLWLNLMRCFYIIIAIDPLIMYWDCHSRHSEVVFSEWWFLHNNRMISLLFWFLYDFIQQQQCMRYTHTYIHTYIQNNNTFSSIGRNAETLAPLQQWFWHLCYFSDLSKKLVSENLTLRIFSTFFSTWVQMSYWWKNKDVCMYGWMVSIQI